MNIFLKDPLLIKTSRSLILKTNYSDPPLIWHCEEYVFQNQGVPCNYRVLEEETKHQIFGLICKGGHCVHLLVVSVPMLVVCSHLLAVCGGFLWLFVFVACFSNCFGGLICPICGFSMSHFASGIFRHSKFQ